MFFRGLRNRESLACIIRRQTDIYRGRIFVHGTATIQTSQDSAKPAIKPFEGIPGIKGTPLIGSLIDYTPLKGFDGRYVFDLWLKRYQKYGDIWKENIPGTGYMVYCHTKEDTETMFRSESRTPQRNIFGSIPLFTRVRNKLGMTDTVVNLGGDEWLKFRQVFNVTLLKSKMVWRYIAMQRSVARDLVKYIHRHRSSASGEVANFQDVLNRWSFEMGGTFVFNRRLGMLEDHLEASMRQVVDAMSELMRMIGESFHGPWQLWKYFDTKELKSVVSNQKQMLNTFHGIIDDFMASAASDGKDQTIMEKIMLSSALSEE